MDAKCKHEYGLRCGRQHCYKCGNDYMDILKQQIEQQAEEIERLTGDNGQQHIEIMLLTRKNNEQEKYAELGRLAIEVSNTNPAITSFCKIEYQKKYHGANAFCHTVKCPWRSFCQKRAELLGDERDADRLSVRDIAARCSRCDKSFDTERMLTNCEGCGRKMICDNCYEKHECEWDGE
jgi:hypothetical protein